MLYRGINHYMARVSGLQNRNKQYSLCRMRDEGCSQGNSMLLVLWVFTAHFAGEKAFPGKSAGLSPPSLCDHRYHSPATAEHSNSTSCTGNLAGFCVPFTKWMTAQSVAVHLRKGGSVHWRSGWTLHATCLVGVSRMGLTASAGHVPLPDYNLYHRPCCPASLNPLFIYMH